MAHTTLTISNVFHDAFINVAEKGTYAAATAVVVGALGVQKAVADILPQIGGVSQLESGCWNGHSGDQCFRSRFSFSSRWIASAINERLQRKLEYALEEIRVFKEILRAATCKDRIPFTPEHGGRLALVRPAVHEGVHYAYSRTGGSKEREDPGAKPELQSVRGKIRQDDQGRVFVIFTSRKTSSY